MNRQFQGLDEMPLELLATIIGELEKKKQAEELDSFDEKRLYVYKQEAKKRLSKYKTI